MFVFVLAEVVYGASFVPYASLGTHEAVQKILGKKFGVREVSAYERKSRFRVIWWHILV